MSVIVVEKPEFDQLKTLVEQLQAKTAELEQRLTPKLRKAMAGEDVTVWLRKRDARKMFGTKDAPIPPSTFNDWIKKWITSGELCFDTKSPNYNAWYVGDELLIHINFITTQKNKP